MTVHYTDDSMTYYHGDCIGVMHQLPLILDRITNPIETVMF